MLNIKLCETVSVWYEEFTVQSGFQVLRDVSRYIYSNLEKFVSKCNVPCSISCTCPLIYMYMIILYMLFDIDNSSQESPKKGGFCLSLSTHSLTVKTCVVLGKVLSADRAFTDIRFNDCMLPEEGKSIWCYI